MATDPCTARTPRDRRTMMGLCPPQLWLLHPDHRTGAVHLLGSRPYTTQPLAPARAPGSPSGRRTGSGRDTAVHVQRHPASARAQHRGRRARPRPGLHLKPVRRGPRRAPRSTWPDGGAQGGTGVGPAQPRPPLPGLWAPLPACPAPSRGCVRPRDLRGASPEDENLAGRGGAAGAQRRPPQPARPRNGASPGLDRTARARALLMCKELNMFSRFPSAS